MTDEVRNDETELNQDELDAQDKADFEAGFNGVEAEYDEHQEESTESTNEDDAAAPATESTDDKEEPKPLTAADIDRIRLEAAAEAEQKHLKRIRDLSGEIGGLKQKLGNLETAKAAAESQGSDAPTTQQIKEASTSGTKLAKLKEDFPEFAEALEEVVGGIKPTGGVDPNDMAKLSQAAAEAQQRAEATAQELVMLQEKRRLDKAHPDWEEVIEDNSYKQWLAVQNPQIQYAATHSNDARDAITILNLYKQSQEQEAASSTADKSRRVSQRLESAVTPTSGKQVTRRDYKTEHDEFLAGFNGSG